MGPGQPDRPNFPQQREADYVYAQPYCLHRAARVDDQCHSNRMKMKTLFVVATLLALTSFSGLAGPTVHKEVHGSWCYSGTVIKGEFQRP